MPRRNMRITWLCILFVIAAILCSSVWAMDEAILTPTKEERAPVQDKEFDDAMGIWFSHRYDEGAKLLKEFSKKNPNNRWAAEADLHVGCYLAFQEHYSEARPVFDEIIRKHGKKSTVGAKATIRLGNIAEREGKIDEAIQRYSEALSADLAWDQFRYANFRARKLIMTKGRQWARINCGPVALAACLEALGKTSEAASALQIKLSDDGMSMLSLATEAALLGVSAEAREISVDQLKDAPLPLIAHVTPNHFIAVLSIDGDNAHVADSLKGKHDESIAGLKEIWSGKTLVFSSSPNLTAMSLVTLSDTVGGCCGQADEDECLGDPDECQQVSDCLNDCGNCGSPSPGSPSWWINTVNLNLLARDTPIWYNPGLGPGIALTLTYSNENSNTGIFGRGWHSPYDMKVFFVPSGNPSYPTLQLHRANGKVETYVRVGTSYVPRTLNGINMAPYGYDDKIEFTNQVPILTLRDGGKYYFIKEGLMAEGRIQYIKDVTGKKVECRYDTNGKLAKIIDANGFETTVIATGAGVNERVTSVTIPDGRSALFGYTNGNLTSITDMSGAASTFAYNALTWTENNATTLSQAIYTNSPINGESLNIAPTTSFPSSGFVEVTAGGQTETIWYSSRTSTTLYGIVRGTPTISAVVGSTVRLKALPYLSEIVTPSKKTKFTYEWWTESGLISRVVALHEVYECGASENYSNVPTVHYSWCSTSYQTAVTYYPMTAPAGNSGCTTHWTGGMTKHYTVDTATGSDATKGVVDAMVSPEVTVTSYQYNSATRDRTAITDANNHTTTYLYDDYHNLRKVADPMAPANTWTREYTYYYTSNYSNNKLHEEIDALGRIVRTYSYNSAGQLTKIDTSLGTELQNFYDSKGRLEHSIDGNGKITYYIYDEVAEPRGFLTAIQNPEGHRTTFHYDPKGRQDQITDANSKWTKYEYDDLDRVTKVINMDGTYVETKYDCCHKLWVKDENGSLTKYESDPKNRLWLVIIAALDTTLAQDVSTVATNIPLTSTAGFPSSGYVLLKSQNGATTEVVWYANLDGNTLSGVTRGQMGTTAKSFTASAGATQGTMAATVYDGVILDRKILTYDAAGRTTQYNYFSNGRLEKITYPDGSWESYTYDPVGNVIIKRNGTGSTTIKTVEYVYDANNRLVGTY